MIKRLFIFSVLASLLLINIISAEIQITKEPVTEVVIKELNNPALFNFTIKNLGDTDNFEIYSLVGVDFSPRGTFQITSLNSVNMEVQVYPEEKIRNTYRIFNFEYKIRGSIVGIKNDNMMIKILPLKDIVTIKTSTIRLNDNQATVIILNSEKNNFPELTARFSSDFFDSVQTFSLGPLEEKRINVSINKDVRGLFAGSHDLDAEFQIGDKKIELEGKINYIEEPGVQTNDESFGFIITREDIEKLNKGNLPVTTQIAAKKNIISRLLTTFSVKPDYTERRGTLVYYFWNKEIQPGESFKVSITTNWLYPIIVVIVLVVLMLLLKLYLTTVLSLGKTVSFVKTKGGEFALKINLTLRARKPVESIRVIDKLPPLVKIFERFGANPPDKVDEKNKRIEWNFPALDAGEVRNLSYIIYSKVGVLGKFILPQATAVFERNTKIKEIFSNKVFFVSEQKGSGED